MDWIYSCYVVIFNSRSRSSALEQFTQILFIGALSDFCWLETLTYKAKGYNPKCLYVKLSNSLLTVVALTAIKSGITTKMLLPRSRLGLRCEYEICSFASWKMYPPSVQQWSPVSCRHSHYVCNKGLNYYSTRQFWFLMPVMPKHELKSFVKLTRKMF